MFFFILFPGYTFAAASITLQSNQNFLQAPDEEYEVNVSLSINQVDGTVYYLRGVFYKPGTIKYCGFTWNGSSWFNGPYSGDEGWKNLLPVTIQSDSWSGKIKARIDPGDNDCKNSDTYNFKVRRYNQVSGSSTFDDQQELAVTVSFTVPSPSPTPTPTATPTPPPSPTPTLSPTPAFYPLIFISEFMPNPDTDEKEWVEIFNSNSGNVELRNWKIDDKEGGSAPESFDADLPALGYRRLFFSSSKLNNDSDIVRLLRPDSSVADSVSFSFPKKRIALAKDGNGNWVETSEATPDEANRIVPVGGVTHKNTIHELKKLTLGSKIELEAFVSVPPNIFSEKEFYVVDDISGIKISISGPPVNEAKLGDRVHLASTIEESYSEKYIKSATYEVKRTGLHFPDPVEIDTGEVIEANEGRLVKVKGKYKASDGDNFYIDDGTGEAKIYIKPSVGIIKPKMSKDDEVEIQGIISQYGVLKDGKANHRVMPRFQSDLRNLTEEGRLRGTVLGAATQLPVTGTDHLFPLSLILAGFILRTVLKFTGGLY